MAFDQQGITIWQWNCRGLVGKRPVLQQHVRNATRTPDVILLQETLKTPAFVPGYQEFFAKVEGRGLSTLVGKKTTAIVHDLKGVKIEHIFVELLPNKIRKESIFVLNIYSNPTHQKQRFLSLFKKATNLAGNNALVIGGDFNAPNSTWGYSYSTVKGRQLWQDSQDLCLTLITDPTDPTRTGNSVTRDTTPDLTFTKNVKDATWRNTGADLGSDHMILETVLPTSDKPTPVKKEFKWTDWEEFRSVRKARQDTTSISDIEEWTRGLNADTRNATKTIATEAQTDRMDSRLARLIEAKASILTRWKSQRLNRKLRKKVAELNRNIEQHCQILCKQQWDELCNSVDGQLHNGQTWKLLKHLLDNTKTKSHQRDCMARLLYTEVKKLGEERVAKILCQKYLPLGPSVTHGSYAGRPNASVDEDFSSEEIRAALHALNGRSAPGPDKVTNKTLRNLDDDSVDKLTDFINEQWRQGSVPKQWKTAKTVLIPKPGKAPSLENLRPISLTSCVGKVMEHAFLNRVNTHLELMGAYPHTVIGFRAHLSTQDAMLQLKHQILDDKSRYTKAILGLDLESAFDRVTHSAILAQISHLNLGERAYNYVQDFLSDRRALLVAGDIKFEEQALGSAGTPQGSVISPMLFNLIMIGLAQKLQKVENVEHTIYADDITIWVNRGSDGQIESSLQEAIDVVEEHLRHTGLRCSPKKSELLLYRPTQKGRPPKGSKQEREYEEIKLHTRDNGTIPVVKTIKVLGMLIESNGVNGETVNKLLHKTANAMRLLKRVTNRRGGMREGSLIRLVHSFVVCHITYVAAFHNWSKAEKNKIDVIIRRAYKTALGLPDSTSTELLLQLGIHNTLDELAEAQRISQLERLTTTEAGRQILEQLGIGYHRQHGEKEIIPRNIRDGIQVDPVPRNVHPTYNQGRRQARAVALLKDHGKQKGARFVDAAEYQDGRRYAAAVVDTGGKLVYSASVRSRHAEVAEEVAIALAISDQDCQVVVTDSRTAIKNYAKGRLSVEACRIIKNLKRSPDNKVKLVWFPAHMGDVSPHLTNFNEVAHSVARGLANRVGESHGEDGGRDRLTTFNDITKAFYLARRTFPPPSDKLCRAQAVAWRQLQTNTYPNPLQYNRIYPDIYNTNICKICTTAVATLKHMLWECKAKLTGVNPDALSSRWSDALRSSSLNIQLWAVQQALEAATRQELDVPTWETQARSH